MGRKTVYNNITTPEKIKSINPENVTLLNDFIDYLKSVGRADTTIKNYKADLLIFFCWCEDELENKYFVDLTKRELARFQNHALNEWGWSSNRLRTVKAAVSSLSNFIENILDDEIKGFKSIVRKIESPPKTPVREKTVLSKEEVEHMLNVLLEEGDCKKACYFALAAYSGRRKSELCRFKVSDFDDSRLVCNGALYKSAPIRTKGRGKDGKQLNCYVLAKPFKPFFDAWMQQRESIGIRTEWLFPRDDDPEQQMPTSTVDGWSEAMSKKFGIAHYVHLYRHFYCTMLAKAGIPDSVITEILGWSSSAMCSIYNDSDADEQIGAFFDENGEICARSAVDLNKV